MGAKLSRLRAGGFLADERVPSATRSAPADEVPGD